MSSIRSPGSMATNTGLLFIIIGASPPPPVEPIARVQPTITPRASGDCKIIMVLLLLLFIMIQLLLVGSEEFLINWQVPLHLL